MNATNTKSILNHALRINGSVLLNGKHGIGKTSVVKQFAKENDLHLETLILSLKDPSDLLGMPHADDSSGNKRTIWLEPDWFQHIVDCAWPINFEYSDLEFNDSEFQTFVSKKSQTTIERNKLNDWYCEYYNLDNRELQLTKEQYNVSCKKSQRSVLFLDELNRAAPDTRNTSLQLVLEKELHSHKLPFVNDKRTFICAAINPPDIYQVDELDIALLDRFLIVDMTIDAEDWLLYARSKQLNSVICDFISENTDKLHYMQKDDENGSTPRAWEELSLYLDVKIDNNAVLEGIICGRIGKEVGSLFYVYYKNYKNIMKMEDIVEKVHSLKEKDPQISINELSLELKSMTKSTETIRLKDLVTQVLNLSREELKTKKYNILSLTLISLLTSLNFEISLAICKKLKVQDVELYSLLVTLDEKINSNKFFTELIKYSR